MVLLVVTRLVKGATSTGTQWVGLYMGFTKFLQSLRMSTERLSHLPEANSKSLQEPESESKCQTRSPEAEAALRPVAPVSTCEQAHLVLASQGPRGRPGSAPGTERGSA